MPSFSKQAISFLAALALTSSIITTTIVCTNDFKFTTRRESKKFSKKKNEVEAQQECTWRNFAGSSKYRNCQKMETKIDIGCGDEDADDTTRMCKVTEHPWNDEQKEEDTTACVVQGLFDPKTHITTDSATGFCHLKFLSLLDSCDVDANSSPSSLFGMKAEIHNSRNTENHSDDNSGMLLRFSHTGGTVYYNDDNPRETVPLHDIIPAERKLNKFATCITPDTTFRGWSCDNMHGNYGHGCTGNIGQFKETGDGAFETCFALGGPKTGILCWSKSHYVNFLSGWFPCVPRDTGLNGNPPEHWYVTQPRRKDGTCGNPCKYFNEDIFYPLHNIDDNYSRCRVDDSGDGFSGTSSTTMEGRNSAFQTCYTAVDKDGNDTYCWAASYLDKFTRMPGLCYDNYANLQCSPTGDWSNRGGHGLPGDRKFASCGEQCTDVNEVTFQSACCSF